MANNETYTMVRTDESNYWINNSALNIALNALGNPEYATCSVAAGAVIMVWIRGVIDFDPNSHSIQHWTLLGAPVAFGTTSRKYVYAAVPRVTDAEHPNALIVFPSDDIDLYGKDANGVQIASETYYYISLNGIISSSVAQSGEVQQRYFETVLKTGTLATEESYVVGPAKAEWYEYSSVSGLTMFLVNLTMAAGKKFLSLVADQFTATTATIANLVLGGQTLKGVSSDVTHKSSNEYVLTPQSARSFFLSKLDDDSVAGDIDFNGTVDVFGNTTLHAAAIVEGNLSVAGTASVTGNATMSSNCTVNGSFFAGGNAGSTSFATGTLGHGWRVYNNGAAEMDSLSLRKFLEVPELRYNKVTVRTGVEWQTFGAGLIENVDPTPGVLDDGETSYDGFIELKLEDGEYGAVAVGDLCMGIFHDEDSSNNASATSDSHDGNFTFAGFMTVYFRVVALADANGGTTSPSSDNKYFYYKLRPTSQTWTSQFHPQPSMSFACYANPTDSSRQASQYSTPDYRILLTGMTDWEYDGDNISLIEGNLNGFTIPESRLVDGSWVTIEHQLSGYGIAFGRAYMWGSIEQFNRERYIVSQQLYYMGSTQQPSAVAAAWAAGTITIDDFSTTPVSPSASTPYVYQLWLYNYNDGTTSMSDPACAAVYGASPSYQIRVTTLTRTASASGYRLSYYAMAYKQVGDTLELLDVDDYYIEYYDETEEDWMVYSDDGTGYYADDLPIPSSQTSMQLRIRRLADNAVLRQDILSFGTDGENGANGTDATSYSIEASIGALEFNSDGSDKGLSVTFSFYTAVGSAARQAFTAPYARIFLFDANGAYIGYGLPLRNVSGCSASLSSLTARDGHSLTEAKSLRVFVFDSATNGILFYQYLIGQREEAPTPLAALSIPILTDAVDGVSFDVSPSSVTIPVDSDGYPLYDAENPMFKVSLAFGQNTPTSRFTSLACQQITGNSDGFDTPQCTAASGSVEIPLAPSEVVTSTATTWEVSAVYNGVTYKKLIYISVATAGASVSGPQGIQGCVLRLMGEWNPTVVYVNQSGSNSSGLRYIDVVQYEENGTVVYYQRNSYATGYAAGVLPTNSTYWSQANMFDFIATKTLLSEQAFLQMCQGRKFFVQDENGNITAGMQTLDSEADPTVMPQFFAGASNSNAASAPFRVLADGSVFSSKLTASGSFNILNEETTVDDDYNETVEWQERGQLAAAPGISQLWLGTAYKYPEDSYKYPMEDFEYATYLSMFSSRQNGSEISMMSASAPSGYQHDVFYFAMSDESGLLSAQRYWRQDNQSKNYALGIGSWYRGIFLIDSCPENPENYKSFGQNLMTWEASQSNVSAVHITPDEIGLTVGNHTGIFISATGINVKENGSVLTGYTGSFSLGGHTLTFKGGILTNYS